MYTFVIVVKRNLYFQSRAELFLENQIQKKEKTKKQKEKNKQKQNKTNKKRPHQYKWHG